MSPTIGRSIIHSRVRTLAAAKRRQRRDAQVAAVVRGAVVQAERSTSWSGDADDPHRFAPPRRAVVAPQVTGDDRDVVVAARASHSCASSWSSRLDTGQ
jgi:hypothetical protein